MENIKTLIQENKDCKMEKGVLCAQHCRDCRYMEMEYRILIIFHFRAVIHCKALRFLLV